MATKIDGSFVKVIREQHDNAKGGFDALVNEVERLENYCEKLERAFIAAHKTLFYVQHVAPGYDWNADPKHLTLKIGAIEDHRIVLGLPVQTIDLTN